MFDDDLDLDFDEILNYHETQTTHKRNNPESLDTNSSKRPKLIDSEFIGNINDNIQNDNHNASTEKSEFKSKKVFRFKKSVQESDISKNNQRDSVPCDTGVKTFITTKINGLSMGHDTFFPKQTQPESTNLRNEKTLKNIKESETKLSQPSQCYKKVPSNNKKSENRFLIKQTESFEIKQPHRTDSSGSVKRLFPGPAGLFTPDCSNLGNTSKESTLDVMDICSQVNYSELKDEPWKRMKEDFYQSKCDDEYYLPDKYTINWIKCAVCDEKLINQKAPFLAAYIYKISSHTIQNPIINIVLKDETGTIEGTILHHFYEEYRSSLIVGSVIVLKDIGVLTMGFDKPFLMITPNNVISIYPTVNKNDSKEQKIIINDICSQEIYRNIKETKRLPLKHLNSINMKVNTEQSLKNITTHTTEQNKFKFSKGNVNNLTTIASSNKANEVNDMLITKEDIDSFLEDDLEFTSTQINQNVMHSQGVLSNQNDDNHIVEGLLDGIDANTFFDDF